MCRPDTGFREFFWEFFYHGNQVFFTEMGIGVSFTDMGGSFFTTQFFTGNRDVFYQHGNQGVLN